MLGNQHLWIPPYTMMTSYESLFVSATRFFLAGMNIPRSTGGLVQWYRWAWLRVMTSSLAQRSNPIIYEGNVAPHIVSCHLVAIIIMSVVFIAFLIVFILIIQYVVYMVYILIHT